LKNDLTKKIKENNRVDGDDKEHQMDLIITKIIMATMGCVPAYDTYFKKGLKEKIKKGGNFNKNSFNNLLNFCREDDELKKEYKKSCVIKGTKIKYPPMKLLDLCFWLLGRDENQK
ncbi:MAG: hypothetical protein Q8Q97_02230, partial [bacterium]|nr:hypothetical protein [bacterium]